MGVAWSNEQVLALAPDDSSAKAGKGLASARKWKKLGANDACVWGEIQGSAKDPYQACIDLSEPAFKCTCPSRKFPCKHSLGLFLIFAQQPGAMSEKQTPAWAAEWLAKRAQRVEKKAVKADDTPPDPEAAAKAAAAAEKRVAAREAKVTAGLDDLGTWLRDLVRSGFATLPGKPAGFWETPAARLVDAQASGLARRLRALDGITTTGEGWPARLLGKVAWLHLACEGWGRVATLPPATQADLRATIGFTEKQEELLVQAGVRDRWLILGQRVEEENGLRAQRTWLFGVQTRRTALCLSFAAFNQPLDTSLIPGAVIEAELVFYPGTVPLRGLIKQRFGDPGQWVPSQEQFPHGDIAQANAYAAAAFAANPWLELVPFALAAVMPLKRETAWVARDAAGLVLPLRVNEDQGWRLLALSGGHPLALTGEWNGEELRVLSAWAEGRFVRISTKAVEEEGEDDE